MKKNISIFLVLILLIGGFVTYKTHNKNTLNNCSLNKSEIDLYVDKVVTETLNYKVQENELDRQATDGSYRKIFTDKNDDVVLIEDEYSGESGFRTVSVFLKNKEVVKVVDELTHYDVPPIEDPASVPTITKDEFYVIDSNICIWYKQGKLTDQDISGENEYLDVIHGIIRDAKNIVGSELSPNNK